jgi:hypothetical protein
MVIVWFGRSEQVASLGCCCGRLDDEMDLRNDMGNRYVTFTSVLCAIDIERQ